MEIMLGIYEMWRFVNERKPANTDHVVFYELNDMQSSLGV